MSRGLGDVYKRQSMLMVALMNDPVFMGTGVLLSKMMGLWKNITELVIIQNQSS